MLCLDRKTLIAMENNIEKLTKSLSLMAEVLEKTQDELADKVDALIEEIAEVSQAIAELRREINKLQTTGTEEDDSTKYDDVEGLSSFEELRNFDADDDLSDDDLERLGYQVK